jgi:23S rRNA (guanosine2251-2'-O)-methyltransferase
LAILIGIHPVTEALRAGHPLDRILVARGAAGSRLQEIIDLARGRGISLRFEERPALDRIAGSAAHQGVVALGAARRYAELDEVGTTARLLVVLDGIEDPHNLGAIIRTACAAGADAVVVPERRAAGLTETVAKAASGALEYLPVVRVSNVNRALEDLKQRGFWIYGLDERGDQDYAGVAYSTPTALVFGAEGRGLHQMTRKHCDVLVRIPIGGKISSLNVSVAAGVVLFDWKRKAGDATPDRQ